MRPLCIILIYEVVSVAKYEYWITENGLTLLEGWARDGLVDEQIAKNCGITATTLYDWKKRFPKISEALKRGKEIVDYEVENALLQKALSGDTTALIYWLKNRRPGKWRDKPIDLDSGAEKINANIESLKALLQSPAPNREVPDE